MSDQKSAVEQAIEALEEAKKRIQGWADLVSVYQQDDHCDDVLSGDRAYLDSAIAALREAK